MPYPRLLEIVRECSPTILLFPCMPLPFIAGRFLLGNGCPSLIIVGSSVNYAPSPFNIVGRAIVGGMHAGVGALLRVMKLVMLLLPWLMLSNCNRVNYSS